MTNISWIVWLILGISLLIIFFYAYQGQTDKTQSKSIPKKKKEISTKKESTSTGKKKNGVEYPSFRKQKSGLTWGGGNVHGANAKRGTKKGFLKK
ncbi:MAG: hypothetical protein WBN16_05385 [Lutimonas sp.]